MYTGSGRVHPTEESVSFASMNKTIRREGWPTTKSRQHDGLLFTHVVPARTLCGLDEAPANRHFHNCSADCFPSVGTPRGESRRDETVRTHNKIGRSGVFVRKFVRRSPGPSAGAIVVAYSHGHNKFLSNLALALCSPPTGIPELAPEKASK